MNNSSVNNNLKLNIEKMKWNVKIKSVETGFHNSNTRNNKSLSLNVKTKNERFLKSANVKRNYYSNRGSSLPKKNVKQKKSVVNSKCVEKMSEKRWKDRLKRNKGS